MAMDLTMWMLLNALDLAISAAAIRYGALEVGLFYQLFGSWAAFTIAKIALAIIIGLLLVRKQRADLLGLLSLGLAGICVYNIWVLVQQARI